MMSYCEVCPNQIPSAVKVKYDAWLVGGSNEENVEKNKMEFVRIFRSTFAEEN